MLTISTLPATTEAEIRELLDSGDYENATDVVTKAVHLFARHERHLTELRAILDVGLNEADRGKCIALTPELMKQIQTEARALAKSGGSLDPAVCG